MLYIKSKEIKLHLMLREMVHGPHGHFESDRYARNNKKNKD